VEHLNLIAPILVGTTSHHLIYQRVRRGLHCPRDGPANLLIADQISYPRNQDLARLLLNFASATSHTDTSVILSGVQVNQAVGCRAVIFYPEIVATAEAGFRRSNRLACIGPAIVVWIVIIASRKGAEGSGEHLYGKSTRDLA